MSAAISPSGSADTMPPSSLRALRRFNPPVVPLHDRVTFVSLLCRLLGPPNVAHHFSNVEQQEIRKRAPFLVEIQPAANSNEPVTLMHRRDQRSNVPEPLPFVPLAHALIERVERGLRHARQDRSRCRCQCRSDSSFPQAALLEFSTTAARARFVATWSARH